MLAVVLLYGEPARAANPSMSKDFERMMQWLSHEMVQGLAFAAGSTFDPPREVIDKRFQPDISLGVGHMPFNKNKFPEPETPALRELNAKNIFPADINFPNLSMHLRRGLPWRSDLNLRVANMTTPPGYKISPTTIGKGQSNSVGFGVRKHVFGGDHPLLSLGANYNHTFGLFKLYTKFNIENVQGFSADSDVIGTIKWSINSFGVNAVVSDTFYRRWTPFFGVGYNHVTGSVRARLEALPNTPLIRPIVGEGSETPEVSQSRVIMGLQMHRSWVNLFANGEVKTIGISSGRSWVIHFGMSLPIHIQSPAQMFSGRYRKGGPGPVTASARAPEPARRAPRQSTARREIIRPELFTGTKAEPEAQAPELIFIQ